MSASPSSATSGTASDAASVPPEPRTGRLRDGAEKGSAEKAIRAPERRFGPARSGSIRSEDAVPEPRGPKRWKLRALRNVPDPAANAPSPQVQADARFPATVSGGVALGRGRRVRFGLPVGAWESGEQAIHTPRVSLRRPQVFADTGLAGTLAGSFLAHLLLMVLLFWRPETMHGSPEASNNPQVEMVFTPSPPHSQRQPSVKETGGGASAPPPTKAQEASTRPQQTKPAAPVPAHTEPSPQGELPDAPVHPRPVPPALSHPRHRARPMVTRRQVSRAQDNNPLAHPQDWSFNAPPVPQMHHRGRRGSRGGPIDLSIGPLSLNGQINAPYKTRSSVRGVSSDYGAEIDRWIHQHLFYPDEAAANGEQGPSAVHVRIDRSGRVLKVYTTHSSGYNAIDTALTGLFRGAQLPPVPPDMSGDHFDLDVTVNYILLMH
ncbi:energy transducer TonB [Oecophyllibacter saccharovorans]|uniref:energy transducer TonB n=1 Tax=Oecophyllibacter saccharovorans TaxID=2558360 RepID=UPI001F4F56EA|nr:energy transducer TonB [Oecophyllibacter saccharovorans]